jgi:ABC-type glutathione transport system ATPase component
MGAETSRIRFEIRDLKKSYLKKASLFKRERFYALRGVDLKIYNGKINALIGPSGCGKSTLARILMKLENFDSGCIRFHSHHINQVNTREFRRKNQILFQNPYLAVNPTFNIYRILSEPLEIARLKTKRIRERIHDLLEVIQIPPSYLTRYPSELSGGELQRVVLARALILNPDFIILDEPLSSLDEIMASRLMIHLKDILARTRIGVLFISHHIRRVRTLADRVSIMTNGRIIYQAPIERFNIDHPVWFPDSPDPA